MLTKNKRLAVALAIVLAVTLLVSASPAAAAPSMDRESCEALASSYGNAAHPEDPEWVSCFVAGWVNWIFGTENSGPLPADPPQAVVDALDHGVFVQLTEPWNPGCDNTLVHPDCSIGYLDLFSSWNDLRAFLGLGKFEQAGIMKDGPWSIGSLWMTTDFVQVSQGDTMPEAKTALFCDGALGLAFAFDGEYPLPSTTPCHGSNTYYLWESWRGGCIGDEPTDENCNVSQLLVYEDWDEMLSFLNDNGWTRGSVWANSERLAAIIAGSATVLDTSVPLPTATETLAPTATVVAPTATETTPTNPTNQDTNDWQGLIDELASWLLAIVLALLMTLIVLGVYRAITKSRQRRQNAPAEQPVDHPEQLDDDEDNES